MANLERGTLARDAARATMVAAGLDDKSIAKVLKRAESMPADYVDPVQAKIDERAKARLENQAASVPASVLVSQSEQRMAELIGARSARPRAPTSPACSSARSPSAARPRSRRATPSAPGSRSRRAARSPGSTTRSPRPRAGARPTTRQAARGARARCSTSTATGCRRSRASSGGCKRPTRAGSGGAAFFELRGGFLLAYASDVARAPRALDLVAHALDADALLREVGASREIALSRG